MLTFLAFTAVLIVLILILKSQPFFELFNFARFKGKVGEMFVAQIFDSHLPKDKYTVIHNITLPTEDGSTQIDHIVLAQYGIFVVETKNMSGWIFGNQKQEFWTQKIFKKTSKFQNPLRQNYKHTQTLEKILKIDRKTIFPVVVFIGDSTFKTPMPENVVCGKEIIDYILSKKEKFLTQEQIYSIKNAIETKMLKRSFATDSWHIKNFREIKMRG
jgi:hypothetical protein